MILYIDFTMTIMSNTKDFLLIYLPPTHQKTLLPELHHPLLLSSLLPNLNLHTSIHPFPFPSVLPHIYPSISL